MRKLLILITAVIGLTLFLSSVANAGGTRTTPLGGLHTTDIDGMVRGLGVEWFRGYTFGTQATRLTRR